MAASAPRPPAGERPTRVRLLVLALACGISFLLYLHRYTWGFIKHDVQREFNWDTVTLGWLDGLFAASYGCGQIPSGMLCDWFGARAVLGSSIVGWSLALAGLAAAGGLASMATARLTFGLAQAACYPVLNKVSKNWFPLAMRSTAQGMIGTFFGRAGGACSFVLFGTVLMGWMGLTWRTALCLFSLAGLACGVLFVLLFRNSPAEHFWSNAAEAREITAGDPVAARAARSRLRWPALAASRSMWFLYVRGFASNLADVFYVYWVPMLLIDVKGLDRSHAGLLAALPLVGGALGGIASGWLQSRLLGVVPRRWARSAVAMTGKGLAACIMLSSLVVGDPLALAGLFLVVKFFCDWEQPAEWGTITDLAGSNSATVFATVNTVGSFAGFLAGPLTGWVLAHYSGSRIPTLAGWNALFVLIAAEYLVAALCWLFIDCTKALPDD